MPLALTQRVAVQIAEGEALPRVLQRLERLFAVGAGGEAVEDHGLGFLFIGGR